MSRIDLFRRFISGKHPNEGKIAEMRDYQGDNNSVF